MDASSDSPLQAAPSGDSQHAADLIRQKLERLYSEEPNVRQEISEARDPGPHSKHQRFILELTSSGKSLAEIQTEWHHYYQHLPDNEKHEVWQEFYSKTQQAKPLNNRAAQPTHMRHHLPLPPQPTLSHNTSEIQKAHHRHSRVRHRKRHERGLEIEEKMALQALPAIKQKPGVLHHFRSLLFGVGMGLIVIFVMLFGLFNERFIIPFITPSRQVSTTPIITDNTVIAVDPAPKIIIPKINIEAPVVYDETSIEDKAVQVALEKGILHYATTANPGELGNAAFFGHSSNNILNRGKYKFAFLLLKSLVPGDTFYIQKDGKRYVYKVFDKKIVPPSEVSVIDPIAGHPATATLITCDPPGFSTNRLVVTADQISPDPTANVASTAISSDKPSTLPSNAPSLWSRIISIF